MCVKQYAFTNKQAFTLNIPYHDFLRVSFVIKTTMTKHLK